MSTTAIAPLPSPAGPSLAVRAAKRALWFGRSLLRFHGTLFAPDYWEVVRVQTRERPEGYEVKAEDLKSPERNPVEYLLHCIETGEKVTGPLSIEISRIGQQIVDTAVLSAREKRTVKLVE